MLTYDYHVRVESPVFEKRLSLHHAIVTGTAPYQFRYRVLLPYAAEAIAQLVQHSPLASSQPTLPNLPYSRRAFELSYIVLDAASLLIFFLSLGEFVHRLFGHKLALFGVVMAALLVGFTFRDQYYHPDSILDGAIFALGMLLLYRQRYWLLAGACLIGLLNRETSVFLIVAFLFYTLPHTISRHTLVQLWRKRDFRFAAGTLIVWVAGFFLLHAVVGYRPATFSVELAISGNRARFAYALLLNVLLFGPAWLLVFRGIPRAPLIIRRAAMMMPAYFGLLLVIGYWWEIRYWIMVIPIVVPALIVAIADLMSVGDGQEVVSSFDGRAVDERGHGL